MVHFEVTVEDGTRYAKGEGKHLRHPLGPRRPPPWARRTASRSSASMGALGCAFRRGA